MNDTLLIISITTTINLILCVWIAYLVFTQKRREERLEEKRQHNLTTRVQSASECKIPVELQNSTNIGLPEATEIPGLDE